MDKDRVKGAATNMGGKAKEGLGNVTGDDKLKSEGVLDQAKGKVPKRPWRHQGYSQGQVDAHNV